MEKPENKRHQNTVNTIKCVLHLRSNYRLSSASVGSRHHVGQLLVFIAWHACHAYATNMTSVRPSVCNVGGLWSHSARKCQSATDGRIDRCLGYLPKPTRIVISDDSEFCTEEEQCSMETCGVLHCGSIQRHTCRAISASICWSLVNFSHRGRLKQLQLLWDELKRRRSCCCCCCLLLWLSFCWIWRLITAQRFHRVDRSHYKTLIGSHCH